MSERHIRRSGSAYCGKSLGGADRVFQCIDHALEAVERGAEARPCTLCLLRIYEGFGSVIRDAANKQLEDLAVHFDEKWMLKPLTEKAAAWIKPREDKKV